MDHAKINRSHASVSTPWKVVVWLVLLILIALGAFKFLPAVLAGRVSHFERFNIAVDSRQEEVVSLSTDGKSATVVFLPSNLQISSVAYGYGQYPISKVYDVGELDYHGGKVFAQTTSELLGVPIDGFVHSQRD